MRIVPAATVVLLAALAASGAACRRQTSAAACSDVFVREPSPDGRFEIVVCRGTQRVAMPGQGGDTPGIVQLRDRATNAVLHATPIDMVQLFSVVTWKADHVSVQLIAEWDLPPPTGN